MKRNCKAVLAATLISVATGLLSIAAAQAQTTDATVNVRIVSDWDVLDPATARASTGIQATMAMYDRLVAYAPGGKVLPYLAESWTETPNAISFKIRRGPTCSDGTPVSASVIKDSLTRLFAPETKSILLARYFGPGPFTVTADDAKQTVRVQFQTPFSDALIGFSWAISGIVCPAGLKAGADFAKESYGSGPYVLRSAAHGQGVQMMRREGWTWGPYNKNDTAIPRPQNLNFRSVENDATASNLLLTGELQLANLNGPNSERVKRSNPELIVKDSNTVGAQVLLINGAAERIGSNPAVRQALMTAIDPNLYLTVAYGKGNFTPSTSFITTNAQCYATATKSSVPKPDPARAREMLKKLGYSEGPNNMLQKGGQPLTVAIAANTTQGQGGEFLLESLKKAGVTATLANTDYATFLQSLLQGKFDLIVNPNTNQSLSSAIGGMSGFLPPKGTNYARIEDADLQKSLQAALSAGPATKCARWTEVQQRIIKSSVILPLGAEQFHWVAKGWDFVALGNYIDPTSLRLAGK